MDYPSKTLSLTDVLGINIAFPNASLLIWVQSLIPILLIPPNLVVTHVYFSHTTLYTSF